MIYLKNGFTLIELLAVIVILAILLLIAFPIVGNIIEQAERKAFEITAEMLISTAQNMCFAGLEDSNNETKETKFIDYNMDGNHLEFSGKNPKNGVVLINQFCQVSLAIHNGKTCVKKNFVDNNVVSTSVDESECVLEETVDIVLKPEQLLCLIKNECQNVTLPVEYIGTEGSWIPISSRDDLEKFKQSGPAVNMIFAEGSQYEKIWNDTGYNDNLARFEQRLIVVNDFDMGLTNFSPIGEMARPFCGTFDGNNKVIMNLNSNTKGLFADVQPTGGLNSTCIMRKVKLNNVVIDSSSNSVGALAGYFRYSNIENITISGQIKGNSNVGGVAGMVEQSIIKNINVNASIIGENYTAGIVGGFYDPTQSIENLAFTGSVDGKESTGGIFGWIESEFGVNNVSVNGQVIGTDTVGGVFGYSEAAVLSNFNAIGSVQGVSNIGGLAGQFIANNDVVLQNLKSQNSVTASSFNAAGLFGEINIMGNYDLDFKDSSSSGIIIGTDAVGGLIGALYDPNSLASINNSFSTSNVQGVNNVGGLVGFFNGKEINNSYSISTINGVETVGGLCGQAHNSTINKSYARGTINGNITVGGLVGSSHNTNINNSYSSVTINASNNIGGLVGNLHDGSIINSYANGNISGVSTIGGLVGEFNGTSISNSYVLSDNITRLSGTDNNIGRVIGLVSKHESPQNFYSNNSFIFIGINEVNALGLHGIGVNKYPTQADFVNTNWDFSNIWKINVGEHPTFK